MKTSKSTSTVKTSGGRGKTWAEKFSTRTQPEVKKLDKDFADMKAGSKMLIATPAIIDEYVRQVPEGNQVDVPTIRRDLAETFQADATCPVTTGIFLRIAAEKAYEEHQQGKSLKKIMPFWRAVSPKSPLAKKLACGEDFIQSQRKREGIADKKK